MYQTFSPYQSTGFEGVLAWHSTLVFSIHCTAGLGAGYGCEDGDIYD